MSTFALPEDLLLAECRALQALARQLTRDRHAAEDAVQDTLVAALTRPGPQPGHVRHWLSAVLRNSLRQQHRAEQRRQRREGDAAANGPAPSANDVCEQLDLHRRLLDMVQALEPAVRQALFLRFWRGMTARAIGDALGLPAKTVQGRIDRGLQQLRRRLDVEAGGRRAWLSMLVPLSGHGLLGLCGGMLAMKTKLLLGAAVVAILCALVPFVWPSGHDVPGSTPPQPPASVRAAEAAPGETASRREVMAPAPAPEAEKAQPAPQVAGTVLDLQGRGVPAVEVRFERDGGEAGVAPARTGADGTFTIAFPAQEGALVVADATWATVRRAWLSRELPAEAPVVIVAPARSYRGSVVDADGAPVAGARVVVIVDQRMVPVRAVGDKVITLPEDLGAVDSDARGRFAFARVGWIEGARVVASHDGHEPAAIALPEASTDDLLLRLLAPSKKSCVYGVVLAADGKAAPGAMVSAGGDAVVTGDDGRFAAPFSPWGKPTAVRAVKPDVGAVSARLVPGPGQPGWSAVQPIVLQLSREPGAVQGRVVDREGRPVAGVAVWTPDLTWLGNVTASEQGHELSFGTSVEGMATAQNRATGPQSVLSIGTTTGADGSFVLRGLLPRSYALFALAPGSMLGAGPVAASPGDTVELRLEAATLRTVAGRVVSRQGAPLANVHIGLGRSFAWQRPQRDEDPWAGSPTVASGAGHVFREGGTVTDAAGRFRLEGVQVQGTRLWFDGDAVFASAPFELDGAQQLDRLEVVVDARSTFRFELVQPGEADAFRFAPDGDRHVSLFVPVEGFVMSMGQLEFAAGRTPQAFTRAGEVTVVLLRNGNEVRRSTVMLPAGGVHTLRL